MHIGASLLREEVPDYLRRGSGLLGRLWVDIVGNAYPEENWIDFVVVVLGWWCQACCALLSATGEGKADFLFMDGPYSFTITSRGDTGVVRFRGSSEEAQVSVREFSRCVLQAANAVTRELVDVEGAEAHVASLNVALLNLRHAFQESAGPELTQNIVPVISKRNK